MKNFSITKIIFRIFRIFRIVSIFILIGIKFWWIENQLRGILPHVGALLKCIENSETLRIYQDISGFSTRISWGNSSALQTGSNREQNNETVFPFAWPFLVASSMIRIFFSDGLSKAIFRFLKGSPPMHLPIPSKKLNHWFLAERKIFWGFFEASGFQGLEQSISWIISSHGSDCHMTDLITPFIGYPPGFLKDSSQTWSPGFIPKWSKDSSRRVLKNHRHHRLVPQKWQRTPNGGFKGQVRLG